MSHERDFARCSLRGEINVDVCVNTGGTRVHVEMLQLLPTVKTRFEGAFQIGNVPAEALSLAVQPFFPLHRVNRGRVPLIGYSMTQTINLITIRMD